MAADRDQGGHSLRAECPGELCPGARTRPVCCSQDTAVLSSGGWAWPGGTAMSSQAIAVVVPGGRCPSQHPWPLPLPSVKYGLWTECLRSACGPRKAGEGGLRGGDLREGGRAGPAASGVPRTLCGDLAGVASGSLPPIRPHACMLCLAERQETGEEPRKLRGPVDVKASQGRRTWTQDSLSPHPRPGTARANLADAASESFLTRGSRQPSEQ